MKASRWIRALLVAAISSALVVAPAGAVTTHRELSKKVTVTGRTVKSSSKITTAADPAIGKLAPVLTGQGFDGQKVTFKSTGKPRIILFLAHWCPHCQAEVPRIVQLAKTGVFDGVEVDTVTTNTSKDYPNYPPSKWLAREKWPFTPVLADDAKAHALLAFGGDAFPFFVFIDASGKIAARASGELTPTTITAAARHLAAGQSLFSKS